MIRSRGEVESALSKAGLGAGLPYGLAEDVAAAGLWLCTRGFDGVGAAFDAIDREHGPVLLDESGATPVMRDARAALAGSCALDLLVAGPVAGRVTLLGVDVPLLLLGLAGARSPVDRLAVTLEFGGVARAYVAPDTVRVDGPIPGHGADVTLERGAAPAPAPAPGGETEGVAVKPAAWEAASRLAAMTYVPASDASRTRGAGAGLRDND